jgi:hypothetical protein
VNGDADLSARVADGICGGDMRFSTFERRRVGAEFDP